MNGDTPPAEKPLERVNRTAPLSGRRRNALRFILLGAVMTSCLLLAVYAPYFTSTEGPSYTPSYSARPARTRTLLLFGVYPLHSPQRLAELYGPVVDLLNERLANATIQLDAPRSYDDFENRLYGRRLHFALPNACQTIRSLECGYRVFGKAAEDSEFRGIILVRRDSGIDTLADLKGRTVSFPAPTALAAAMMPLYYLHTQGVDVNQDIERLFSGSHDSAIMNVYLRKSAAGATRPSSWQAFVEREPEQAAELVVKWETPPLINNSLVVRDDVPDEIAEQVATLLFDLHTHEVGRKLLSALRLARFERATDETYQPAREFMEKYHAAVH